jgi:Zn-dependent protease with chaperone function
VKLDSANRSFLTFMGFSLLLGAIVLCGAAGDVLVPLLLTRISHGGLPHGSALLPMLMFGFLVAVALGRGGHSLLRQTLASRGLAHRVRALAIPLPEQVQRAAAQSELDGRIVVLDASEPFSFVYGMLTPRVAVSRGLVEGTSSEELRAVLEHERYHVSNLDPLKIVLLRALMAALCLLPALGALRARYLAGRELAADRRAIAACGHRSLAGALLKVVRGPEWSELEVAAAIGGPDLLDARITQLETGAEPKPEPPSTKRVTLSLLGATVLAATFLASVSAFGGPTAVRHATGTGLASATTLGSFICTAPLAGAGLLAYLLIALRARRPLPLGRHEERGRPTLES